MSKPLAVVAMSGGVDSSVAAALMKDAGYDVIGVMMKLWSGPAANNESGCCSVDAAEDARRVSQVLGIPFYVFNFAEQFSSSVVSRFVSEYSKGRTPNPCITCNRAVKFSLLSERARSFGAQVLATGHYARVADAGGGRKRLLRGLDASKDQSYVLYMLDQEELRGAAFPVGALTKPEVRSIASSLGLRTAGKPESQEICFVPGGDTHAFLSESVPGGSLPGPILSPAGDRIGTHRGFAHYTVGQRRGLGVSVGEPLYVRSVSAGTNTVVAAPASELAMTEMDLEEVSFAGGEPPASIAASVMTRYRGPESPGRIVRDSGRWKVLFDQPQGPAAPGQAAVFYRGEEVLGGGTITAIR